MDDFVMKRFFQKSNINTNPRLYGALHKISDERFTDMLDTIIEWTQTPKCPFTFDSEVVYGIKEFSESSKFKGYSERQKDAIENIYESFRLKKIYGKK